MSKKAYIFIRQNDDEDIMAIKGFIPELKEYIQNQDTMAWDYSGGSDVPPIIRIIDKNHTQKLIQWLKEINCKVIVRHGDFSYEDVWKELNGPINRPFIRPVVYVNFKPTNIQPDSVILSKGYIPEVKNYVSNRQWIKWDFTSTSRPILKVSNAPRNRNHTFKLLNWLEQFDCEILVRENLRTPWRVYNEKQERERAYGPWSS